MAAEPKPNGKVLKSVGYGKGLVNSPHRVLESQGFKQALRELGLTEELITSSLVEDIQEKKKNRLGELRLGAEILGMNKPENEPEKPKTSNTYNFFFDKETQDDVKKIEAKIKERLTQKSHVQTP